MSISSEPSHATGRPGTPSELKRDLTPDQPVLLVGADTFWDRSGITDWLTRSGWSWSAATNAERARWLASIQKVSLILVSGGEAMVWSAVEAIRPVTMAPLVVLANPTSTSVVKLVSAGVDAVVDPASGPDEVFARVVALLRRTDHGWEPGVRHLRAGDLEVDLWSQECTLSGTQLQLSPTEYSLLTFLMTHPQQALATHTIVRRVWGWLPSDGKNALRIFVNRLRRKLGDDPRHPVYIASVRGTGYRFIRNVAELGDTAETANDRVDVSPLLRTVEDLARVLQSCDSLHDGAESLLGALDATGYADGMAVFRVDGSSMQLVASRNMPESWTEAVKAGVPLKPSYASAQSVLMGEPVQFGDVTAVAKHFSSTAVQLEGFGACLFIPIMLRSSVWGHLGFVRRSRQPFDVTGTAFLRTVCAVFALGIERARAAQQVETPR